MSIKWKIFTTAGILVALGCTYVWGIPALINFPHRKNLIEQKVFESSGIKVDLGNANLSMGKFPSIWIKSDNISVVNNDNSKALSIDNPKVNVKLFPLLYKKLEFGSISSEKELVNLKFTKDKKFLLGDYEIKIDKKNDFQLNKINVDLGNYEINLDDELNHQNLKLSGKNFKHVKYVDNEKLQFETNGSLTIDGKTSNYYADVDLKLPLLKITDAKLKLNADIKNFDLSSVSDYVNVFSKGFIKKTEGILNFSSSTADEVIYSDIRTKNLSLIGKDTPSSIIFKDRLNLVINFKTINKGVKFEKVLINAKNLSAEASGMLKDSGKKVPAMDLKIKINPSRGEQLCKLIPGIENLLPDMNLYKLKSYYVSAAGEGNLHFVGNGDRPDVFGKVKLSDMYIIRRIPNSPKGADVNLNFRGKIMDLDVYVPTGPKEDVRVYGIIKIDGSKYSELKVKSKGNVALEPAQVVLIPLQEVFKFKLGPVPIMKIKGFGSVDVSSSGTKIDPHLFGSFKFNNATASFNRIHNLEMTNASGVVNFNDTKIDFKTFGGFINGKNTKIHGNCDVKGNLNVFAQTNGQKIPDMLKVINTSEDMAEVQQVIKPFTHANGVGDLFLNIYGNANDVEEVKFNKDIFAKGKITLHNATTILQDTYLPITNINGVVNFANKNADYDISGFVRGSKAYVNGTATEKKVDLVAKSDKFKLTDLFDLTQPNMNIPYKKEIGDLYASFVGGYKGNVNSGKLDFQKIYANGKLLSNNNNFDSPVQVSGGTFSLKNGILRTNNIKGHFHSNPYTLSFTGKDIYSSMKISDAAFIMDDFNLASVNSLKEQFGLPKEIKSQLDNIIDINGTVDIRGSVKNGKLWADTNLENISFIYKPSDGLVRILNGKANVRGNTVYLGNINTNISSMPVFIKGKISNYELNPYFDLYLTGKFTQMFFDRFVNNKSIYPVKIKGDVNFISKIKGNLTKLYTDSSLNVEENSSLYYMGATLSGAPSGLVGTDGIATNPVSILLHSYIYPKEKKLSINSLKYIQEITSQNKRVSVHNQLVASGDISVLKDKVLSFKDLKIKTIEPTNARIFNLILKKPTIKQGLFNADLKINGTSISPKVLGYLKMQSIDIPLLDATIRDVALNFEKDYLYLKTKGIVLTNDINIDAKIINNTKPPVIVEDLNIWTDAIDLNIIADRFNDFDTESIKNRKIENAPSGISPDQVIINKAEINADNVIIKKAVATDFKASAHLGEDHIFKVDQYSFKIANGIIKGILNYNLQNLNLYGEMDIKDADAQTISENFFDMNGHLYGVVKGDLRFSCFGQSGVQCVNTLSGDGKFDVKDGRMPKLGSLEYLLKAANLITGGFTGVSINGIIDLITPLKTGEFSKISGDIKVKNGIANDVEVFSSGKELNMYMTGSYNLVNYVADMEVYGSLSKDFSTLLGKISNFSLKRFFNRIPGISINEISPTATSKIYKIPNFDKDNVLRVFRAEINGDINGSNYVKSFRWIKN